MTATLIVKDEQSGSKSKIKLTLDRLRIGKKNSVNDLVLARSSISRQHCVLQKKDGQYYIKDMNSSNGTYLNGQRLSGEEVVIPNNATITLGEFEITYQNPNAPDKAPAMPSKVSASNTKQDETNMLDNRGGLVQSSSTATASPPKKKIKKKRRGPQTPIPLELKRKIHAKLRENKQIRLMDFSKVSEEEAWNTTRDVVDQIIHSIAQEIPRNVNVKQLIKEILDEALKLGPLEELLEDDSVTEIMVNHSEQIFVEQDGHCQLSEKKFTDNDQVVQVIRRILAPLGRRIDETSPLVDARLRDGSRVNAVIPPLAVTGPCITIRKFPKERLTVDHLVGFGTLTPPMAQFLQICVQSHKNIVISGGTGSGKTTLLNIISSFIPKTERIVTIEDVSELKLPQEHVVTLESRPPNLEGKGAIGIKELVINSLRMRPDRIVVGECRGGEALDMLQAMNTGHDGSLTTLHANSPRDAISRMETMVLMAGTDLPSRAIREQIASAVDIIIQQSRLTDGSRKILKVTEVTGMEGQVVTMQDIFSFEQKGYDADGKVAGYHKATGTIPKFIQEMRKRGLSVDMGMFAA